MEAKARKEAQNHRNDELAQLRGNYFLPVVDRKKSFEILRPSVSKTSKPKSRRAGIAESSAAASHHEHSYSDSGSSYVSRSSDSDSDLQSDESR